MRALALLVALAAPASFAQASVEGWGRITVVGGYRWTPNWYFLGKAAEAGYPLEKASPGGPAVTASFGYGATSLLEVAIDAFFAWETFKLEGLQPFNSFSYGGAIGPRLVARDALFHAVTPWVAVQAGPVFATVQSSSLEANPERVLGAFFVAGGLHVRLADRWALTLDVRWIYARGMVPGISGVNVGGVVFSLGVTSLFPPAPKRELDVPGFTAPSNL